MSGLAVTYLFVPGDRPERVLKAIAAGSDAVIIDLEDAVAAEHKAAARAALAQHWSDYRSRANASDVQLLVRINPAGTAWHAHDLEVLASLDSLQAVVPKAESAQVLQRVAAALPGVPLYPLLESAEGFHHIHEVAACKGVARLILGHVDLMLDVAARSQDAALDFYRSTIVFASRVAELPPPVDGVCVALADAERMDMEVARAIDFGFAAKLLIHPKQVERASAGFAPTPKEVSWAELIVSVSVAAQGAAVAVDGKMVDRPVLLQAQRVLERAARRMQG